MLFRASGNFHRKKAANSPNIHTYAGLVPIKMTRKSAVLESGSALTNVRSWHAKSRGCAGQEIWDEINQNLNEYVFVILRELTDL